MTEATLLGSGLVIGFLGTLLGLGGVFILVPFLLYAYHFPKPLAVGTSHFVICLNAFSGAVAYDRQHKIDYNLALAMAAAAIPASAFAGWYLVPRFDSPWFLIAFAAMLVFGAAYVAFRPRIADREPAPPAPGAYRTAIAVSAASGLVAATLGIGGGVFYVPLLAVLLGRPFHRATATSQFILLLSSLVAAAILMAQGQCSLRFAAWLGIGVIAGAQAGAALAPRLKAPALKNVFAGAVLAVAAKLIWDGVRQLG